jgi:hypothetical protein
LSEEIDPDARDNPMARTAKLDVGNKFQAGSQLVAKNCEAFGKKARHF